MMRVRELPPLDVTYDIETPDGNRYRWAGDERKAERVPNGAQWTDTMPGGFEQLDVTLSRKPDTDYRDLERLSTIKVRGVGGGIVGEYRLERAPRVSGQQMSVSPSAVGWQAALEDNKTVQAIYIDRDLSHWTQPGLQRQANTSSTGDAGNGSWEAVSDSANPGLFGTVGNVPFTKPRIEAWYDAGASVTIATVRVLPTLIGFGLPDANLTHDVGSAANDVATSFSGNDLKATNGAATTVTFGTARRYVMIELFWNSTAGGTLGTSYGTRWQNVSVIGNNGLTLRGSDYQTDGFYASDIAAHAVGAWAPTLNITSESVAQSALIVSQAAFREPTTVAEIIRQVTRYELLDWAVWDNKTYWQHERGARGRAWRARIGPSQLQETGPQIDRVWNSVLVSYQDVSGATRTVGPVGSGADTESDDLRDSDPENPATKLGIERREHLALNVDNATLATALGQRFLEETKRLDRSGRAQITGYVEDDRGITWPYHAVRAGDTITFVDASDPSPRRIVRTQKSEAARTCSLDLDAPPDGLAQVLARLGVT